MPFRKTRAFQIQERRTKVASLYLHGRTQTEIAQEVGVSQPLICTDLKAIQAEWLASRLRDFDADKARELARIDEIERELWAAWGRSQLDREVETTEDGTTPQGEFSKTTKKREGQVGEAAFIAGIHRCIEQRCKILGLYAPVKQEHSGVDGEPIKFATRPDLSRLSDDELAEFKRLLFRASPLVDRTSQPGGEEAGAGEGATQIPS